MKRMDTVIIDTMTINENFPILKTGFNNIDGVTGYLRKGCVSLLCSRPGMGELALAAQFGANAADNGGPVVWFSTYRSAGESADTFIRANPTFRSSQNVFFEDKIADVRELRRAVEKMEQKPELVIIHQLQGMYRISKSGRAVYGMPYVCAALRDLARRHGIAVLLLITLARPMISRRNHTPLLTDIPKWEKIRKFVDTVGLLHRRGYYEIDDSDIQRAELFIGPCIDSCAVVNLLWDSKNSRFLPNFYEPLYE